MNKEIKREFAIIGIVVGLVLGLLGGWFIPSPIQETETPLIDKIEARGELLVGTSADYPPFENKTYPGGLIVGFDIDLSQMVADELGVTLKMVDIPFDSLIAACRAGTVDMLAAALAYTVERAERLAASITYITVSQVVIALNASTTTISSINDVTSHVVGVQTGTVMYEELGPDGLDMTVGVELIVYDNANDLMIALDGGAIDLAYVDEPVYTAWSDTYNIKSLYSTGTDAFVLYTRLGETGFLHTIDTVIFESYQDGSIFDVMNTWFG